MNLFTLALTLFLVMNPLGNMKHFLSLLDGLNPRRQAFVIAREMVLALIIMFVFSFFGETISGAFHIQEPSVVLASGVIIFLSAIKVIFSKEEHVPRIHGEEPFLVPIAIPIVASPALLATIMLFSRAEPLVWPMVVSILVAWIASGVLLLNSRAIVRLIGSNGLLALEKLMGMILILISVQRLTEGVLLASGHGG